MKVLKIAVPAALLAAAGVFATSALASPAGSRTSVRDSTTACAPVPGGSVCEIAVGGYAETELDVTGSLSGVVVMWQGTRGTSEGVGCTNSSCTFGAELALSRTVPTCEMLSVPGVRTIVYGPVCLYPRR